MRGQTTEFTNGHGEEEEQEDEMMENDMYGEGNRGTGNEDDEDLSSNSYVSESSSGTSSSVVSWINWYCSLPGHEFFVEIPEEFIEDDFNLTGLNSIIPHYNDALDMILDLESEEPLVESQMTQIEAHAEALYGLIHQRFIITKQGLQAMADKYQNGDFGVCPRELCHKAFVVPCGLTDQLGKGTVKMFCPRCGDVYHPREAKFQSIDGSYFGTTFPHMLFMTYPTLAPPVHQSDSEDPNIALPDYEVYIPRVFGFRVSELSATGPRM
ncbi:casein kinase 2 regulatory subunit, partial [Rhizophlyctis rosea]